MGRVTGYPGEMSLGNTPDRAPPPRLMGFPRCQKREGGAEDLWLVGTPLPRPAVAALASWPEALPGSPPSTQA